CLFWLLGRAAGSVDLDLGRIGGGGGRFFGVLVLLVGGQLNAESGAAAGADKLLVEQGVLVHRRHHAAGGAGDFVLGLAVHVVLVLIVDVEQGAGQIVHVLVHGVQFVIDLVQGVVMLGHGGGHRFQQVHHRSDDAAVFAVGVELHAIHQAADI